MPDAVGREGGDQHTQLNRRYSASVGRPKRSQRRGVSPSRSADVKIANAKGHTAANAPRQTDFAKSAAACQATVKQFVAWQERVKQQRAADEKAAAKRRAEAEAKAKAAADAENTARKKTEREATSRRCQSRRWLRRLKPQSSGKRKSRTNGSNPSTCKRSKRNQHLICATA